MKQRIILFLAIFLLSCNLFSQSKKPEVTLYSDVDNVKVYINEEEIGFTPLTITNLVPGTYLIKAQKENFNTKTFWLTITDETVQEYEIEMDVAVSHLSFINYPNEAIILVDKIQLDNTQKENGIDLSTGLHDIEIFSFGYNSITEKIKIVENEDYIFNKELQESIFEITNFKINKNEINFNNASNSSKVKISFDITKNEPITLIISKDTVIVNKFLLTDFTKQQQVFFWDGHNSENEIVEDGIYNISIENTTYSENIFVDSTLSNSYVSIDKSGNGLLNCPTAKLLPKNTFTFLTNFAYTFNTNENIDSTYSIPTSLSILYTPLSFLECTFSTGLSMNTDSQMNYSMPLYLNASIKIGNSIKNISFAGIIDYTYLSQTDIYFSPNGLNIGGVISYTTKHFDFSLSSFAVFSPTQGIFTDDLIIWKSGLGIKYFSKIFSIGIFTNYYFSNAFEFGCVASYYIPHSSILININCTTYLQDNVFYYVKPSCSFGFYL